MSVEKTSSPLIAALVELIASEFGMAQRLLDVHGEDKSGHCRACQMGGQTGFQRWPCTISAAAESARDQLVAELSQ